MGPKKNPDVKIKKETKKIDTGVKIKMGPKKNRPDEKIKRKPKNINPDASTPLKPFACGLCDKKFNNIYKFFHHFKIHEEVEHKYFHYCKFKKTTGLTSSALQCFPCKQIFPTVCQLDEHYRSQHKVEWYSVDIKFNRAQPHPGRCIHAEGDPDLPKQKKTKHTPFVHMSNITEAPSKASTKASCKAPKGTRWSAREKKVISYKETQEFNPLVLIERMNLFLHRNTSTNDAGNNQDIPFTLECETIESDDDDDEQLDSTAIDNTDETVDDNFVEDDTEDSSVKNDDPEDKQISVPGEDQSSKVEDKLSEGEDKLREGEEKLSDYKDGVTIKTEPLATLVEEGIKTSKDAQNNASEHDTKEENKVLVEECLLEEEPAKPKRKPDKRMRNKTILRAMYREKARKRRERMKNEGKVPKKEEKTSDKPEEEEVFVVRGLRSGAKVVKIEVEIDGEIDGEEERKKENDGKKTNKKTTKYPYTNNKEFNADRMDKTWQPPKPLTNSERELKRKQRNREYYISRKTICDICEIMIDKTLYKKHLAHHETEKGKMQFCTENMVQCDKCGTKMQRLVNTLSMVKTHRCDSVAVRKVYERLGKTFPLPDIKKRNRKKRKMLNNNAKSSICYICGKIYTRSGLRKHLTVTHTESRPFSCDICGRKFKVSSLVTQHKQRVHMKKPPEQADMLCCKCGLKVKSKMQLVTHMRENHEDKSIHQCKTCKKTFQMKKNLLHHEQLHWVPTLQCTLCFKMFPSTFHLNKHKGSVHRPKIRNWVCLWPDCNQKFNESGILKCHMLRHTGEKAWKCRFCDADCIIDAELRLHLRRNHEVMDFTKDAYIRTEQQTVNRTIYRLPMQTGDTIQCKTFTFHRSWMKKMNIPMPPDAKEDENEAEELPQSLMKTQTAIVKKGRTRRSFERNVVGNKAKASKSFQSTLVGKSDDFGDSSGVDAQINEKTLKTESAWLDTGHRHVTCSDVSDFERTQKRYSVVDDVELNCEAICKTVVKDRFQAYGGNMELGSQTYSENDDFGTQNFDGPIVNEQFGTGQGGYVNQQMAPPKPVLAPTGPFTGLLAPTAPSHGFLGPTDPSNGSLGPRLECNDPGPSFVYIKPGSSGMGDH